MFILNSLYPRCCKIRNNRSDFEKSSNENVMNMTFSTRLSAGFILALLFSFQKLGTTVFFLLNCVPLEDGYVLFIDANVKCYTYWQYAVLTYAISCVVPFCLVLMFGPSLMIKGYFNLSQFFFACLCPLPIFTWCLIKKLYQTAYMRNSQPIIISSEIKVVYEILQGPFRELKYNICWGGILIGRRLVIILLYTFVNNALIRLLGMFLTCFIILLHHTHVQPYKDKKANIAGTASAATLVVLCCINLVRAGFEAAEYQPVGPNALLMRAFSEIENLLMLWFPLIGISIIFLLFIIRIFALLFKCNEEESTSQVTNHIQIAEATTDI